MPPLKVRSCLKKLDTRSSARESKGYLVLSVYLCCSGFGGDEGQKVGGQSDVISRSHLRFFSRC